MSRSARIWALLIGIDCYLRNRLPNGKWYPSLGGSVRDIGLVEAFLRSRLGLDEHQIVRLTASYTGTRPLFQDHNFRPPEPPEQWPTYANMVAAFQRIAERAQPNDQVYIHYSGHGGRASSIYPQIKGQHGYDEALVPTDIGDSEARYLRDVELAYLLKTMVDKGLIVTVVLDCCHSGSATRSAGAAQARGIGVIDTTPRPSASLVAPAEALVAAWPATTRNVRPGTGWLLEPQGYTLLAACRAQEWAYEYPFDETGSHGVLTYWLIDALAQLGPGLSYKMLHDRIHAKVRSLFQEQTPQLQGLGERVVFGSDAVRPVYAVPVLRIHANEQRVLLGAGQAHGLRKGAQAAVYPQGLTDFTRQAERLALLELTDVSGASSWAQLVTTLRPIPIQEGDQAVVVHPGLVRRQHLVRLSADAGQLLPEPWQAQAQAALEQVGTALAATNNNIVRLATEGEAPTFLVAVDSHGQYQIQDAAGSPIPHLRPALPINDPASPTRLAQRLIHLAKYRNVQELDNHDPLSPLARKLVVTLAGKQHEYDPADRPMPQPFEHTDTPVLHPDEWVFVRIQNRLPRLPDAPMTEHVLNITVLALQPDWSICQIYPSGPGALFEPLDPEDELLIPLQATIPDGHTTSVDTIKVFATVDTTSFRWLELPALDQPLVAQPATRGTPASPLEQLLMTITEQRPQTRNLSPAAFASREWTTAQIEICIQPTTT